MMLQQSAEETAVDATNSKRIWWWKWSPVGTEDYTFGDKSDVIGSTL